MLEFRPLTVADFPLMLEWLSKKHVKEWWDDGEDTLEKVAAHYGETDNEAVRYILIERSAADEKPLGYFQYYFLPGGEIGIDQFIGEPDYINRGVGEKAIKMFVEMIRREHDPAAIVLDPSPENKRAIRCYEKVGFRHFETKTLDNGDSAYMMRLACGAIKTNEIKA